MDPHSLRAAARGYLITATFLCAAGKLYTAGAFVAEAAWALDKAAAFSRGFCAFESCADTLRA